MWSFQIRYMIPIRRASACVLPSASVAKTLREEVGDVRPGRAPSSRLTAQSNARPSLCSETPPSLQEREMPSEPLPGYCFCSHADSLVVPGLAFGLQLVCGS